MFRYGHFPNRWTPGPQTIIQIDSPQDPSLEERAEQERQGKEAALERSALLAERLRALGVNPDEL